jgi:hypothetical protein
MGYDAGHITVHQKRLYLPRRPGASDSADPSLTQLFGRNAMLSFDSYPEVLNEHARGHHVVGSAWFAVVAVIVFLVVFA